ncbi:MAG TPA: restriction endonuclease [Stellaceae bacterium]|jgi:restriction system protein|nr:restriction endonuclease [Stellaceae bacterium]
MNPILTALRDLGGSARPGEVFDRIADNLGTTEQERADEHQSGGSRFENDVAWARFYLVRSGYLDSSRRGVWSLTELGRQTEKLSDEQISQIIRVVQETAPRHTTEEPTAEQLEKEATEQAETAAPEDVPRGYRERALEIMGKLPANGFERLCQRLLRESGFQQVKITGRSGDGGIDGIGILQVNPFVSFKVLFQCKRWTSAVGSPVVRDFRGAMIGRADKGLILTTSTFTTEAQSEAVRDGASPIELVDGQALVSLLEQLELGLIPRTTYEVDSKFFEEFDC